MIYESKDMGSWDHEDWFNFYRDECGRLREQLANSNSVPAPVSQDEVDASEREQYDKSPEGQLEFERLRLAACGVAAGCNTAATIAKHRLAKDNPYRSASYDAVCSAVDREMKLRNAMTYARRLILNRNPSGAGELLDEVLGQDSQG